MYRPGKFAKLIGVSIATLRNWDKQGILKPALKTPSGERRYSEEQLQQFLQNKSIHKAGKTAKGQNKSDTNSQQLKNSETHLGTTEQDKPATTNRDVASQHAKTIKTDIDTKEHNKPTTTNKSDVISQVCRKTAYIYEYQTKPDVSQSRINIGYARVSSQKQEDDLKRQIELLELFLVRQGNPLK